MGDRAIDVYEAYQGQVSWPQVVGSGVRRVFVKLTNGAGPARVRGDNYVNGARGAGARVGGYHYALGGDPVAQANAFADELLRLNALDLAPALDYEDHSLPKGPAAQAWIRAFLTQLNVRIPQLAKNLLYGSGSDLQAMRAWEITAPGADVLEWDAEYGVNDGVEHPIRYYTGGHVAVHQYTSAGRVPGIAGLVDLDDIEVDVSEGTVFVGGRPSPTPGTAASIRAAIQTMEDCMVKFPPAMTTGYDVLALPEAYDVTLVFAAKTVIFGGHIYCWTPVDGQGTGGDPKQWRVEVKEGEPIRLPSGTTKAHVEYSCASEVAVFIQLTPRA
ncbi:glycoside hydrolase family 25 protein [Amycolatopsis kentuckyensis]|uniref:glycoside hydrolase family 25 protein n=1 Tax=Amycolatopsis kentuckyensis TaxID=218823 RepID=UPI003569CC0F